MSTYRERREARADRLDEWAAKREAKAAADLERAHDLASVIPLGQPILAGHYSQGRDTRYRARIDSTMRRGMEHANKARDMASRAEGIRGQLDRSIYSDDVDAVPALEARLAELEAERDRIKAFNASCRKGAPDWSVLTPAEVEHHRRTLEVAAWQCKGGAFPSYALSNLSGNIKRNRDRLATLRLQAAAQGRYRRIESEQEPVGLIGCEVEGCRARFFLVESREFPTLCLDHSDAASREAHGWTPENSL